MFFRLLPLLVVLMIGVWGLIFFNSFDITLYIADLLSIIEKAWH